MQRGSSRLVISGFTLFEILIVIAIIGILVLIAVPSYHTYTRRAHYVEVVQAAAPYKLGVEECFHVTGTLSDCSAGKHGVPAAVKSGKGHGLVDSISVDRSGTIIVVPREKFGITPDNTYMLVPSVGNGALMWTSGGGGVESGFAN